MNALFISLNDVLSVLNLIASYLRASSPKLAKKSEDIFSFIYNIKQKYPPICKSVAKTLHKLSCLELYTDVDRAAFFFYLLLRLHQSLDEFYRLIPLSCLYIKYKATASSHLAAT